MACYRMDLGVVEVARVKSAIEKLDAALALGTVKVVVGASGSIAFKGWNTADRDGLADVCAFRRLGNSPALRKALARAEALAGRKVDPRAINAGVHSHDGGSTWGTH